MESVPVDFLHRLLRIIEHEIPPLRDLQGSFGHLATEHHDKQYWAEILVSDEFHWKLYHHRFFGSQRIRKTPPSPTFLKEVVVILVSPDADLPRRSSSIFEKIDKTASIDLQIDWFGPSCQKLVAHLPWWHINALYMNSALQGPELELFEKVVQRRTMFFCQFDQKIEKDKLPLVWDLFKQPQVVRFQLQYSSNFLKFWVEEPSVFVGKCVFVALSRTEIHRAYKRKFPSGVLQINDEFDLLRHPTQPHTIYVHHSYGGDKVYCDLMFF